VQNYTPDQINLFVRVAAKRRAHETVMHSSATAVAVSTGMSGKRDGFMKFARKMLRGHDGANADAGGESMATFRDRLHSLLPMNKGKK